MKVVLVRTPGGPEALEVCEAPTPVPGPNEVLIRAEAFGPLGTEMLRVAAARDKVHVCVMRPLLLQQRESPREHEPGARKKPLLGLDGAGGSPRKLRKLVHDVVNQQRPGQPVGQRLKIRRVDDHRGRANAERTHRAPGVVKKDQRVERPHEPRKALSRKGYGIEHK